jgi:hypothetical protein
MIIKLDTSLITQYGLEISEALLLGSKLNPSNNGEQQQIIKLSKMTAESIDKIDTLHKLITIKKDMQKKESDKWAEEFFMTFPHKCIRPDGSIGFLRQGILKRKMFVEYGRLIKSEEQHRRAMEFMINDIETRKREGSLGYCKSIVNYILDKPWGEADETAEYKPYGGSFK